LLLLAGAGLLIKSFYNLRKASPGFDPSRVVMMDLVVPGVKYPQPEQQVRFFDSFLPKLGALPGVESVGGANPLPFSNNNRGTTFSIAGQPPIPRGSHPAASQLVTNPGYFRTMGIPLMAGRDFDQHDSATSAKVVIVNEAFARKFLPDKNPLGQKVLVDREDPNPTACEIVGLVGNSKHDSLREESNPEFYTPYPQEPARRVFVVLRTTASNLLGLNTSVRRLIQETDKDIFVPKLQPMETLLGVQLAQPRFNMILLTAFAGVAMALAAIGIYGVIGYGVAQRTREIGIRMALGAQRGDVLRMVLQQSLMLVVFGLLIGLIASFAGTRLLSSLLYGVGANDLVTYFSVIFLLGGAALVASYIPARRAMSVDPMIALRYE
jgi:putative ABC transport system permease protein